MKTKLLSLILVASLFVVPRAQAQYAVAVVSDPIAQANHAEDIAQWLNSIQALNTQIQQFQQQIQIGQTVESYIGNPAQAASSMQLQLLNPTGLSQSVGQLTSALNQTVDGAKALEAAEKFADEPNLPADFHRTYAPNNFAGAEAICRWVEEIASRSTVRKSGSLAAD